MIRSERQEKMTELRKEIEKKDKMIKLCLASHDTFNNCHDIEKALKAKERLAKHKQQKQVFDFFLSVYQFYQERLIHYWLHILSLWEDG